jgi:hypothetical protein
LLLVKSDSNSLVSAHGTSTGSIFAILHEDLGIMKKSAIWVFKLLSQEQMEMRVEISETLLRMIIDKGKTFHGSIILQTSWLHAVQAVA